MKKIMMATAIALVAGSPLAFAQSMSYGRFDPTTKRCSVIEYDLSQAKFRTETDRLVTAEKDLSVCRVDRSHDAAQDRLNSRTGAHIT
jgi:hypothetical protein